MLTDICPSRDDAQPHITENGACVLCLKPVSVPPLKRFQIVFNARRIGSIGITSLYTETVDAPDIWAAVSQLYKTYEHIRLVTHNNGNAPEI